MEVYQPKNPNMPSVSWLVFNVHKNELRNARARFVRQFGRDAFDQHIKPLLAEGIMSIFQKSPTDYTLAYVNSIGEMVDRRTYPQGFAAD